MSWDVYFCSLIRFRRLKGIAYAISAESGVKCHIFDKQARRPLSLGKVLPRLNVSLYLDS